MRPPTMTDEEADALWLEMCLELAKPPIETIAVNDNAGHIPVRKGPGTASVLFRLYRSDIHDGRVAGCSLIDDRNANAWR